MARLTEFEDPTKGRVVYQRPQRGNPNIIETVIYDNNTKQTQVLSVQPRPPSVRGSSSSSSAENGNLRGQNSSSDVLAPPRTPDLGTDLAFGTDYEPEDDFVQDLYRTDVDTHRLAREDEVLAEIELILMTTGVAVGVTAVAFLARFPYLLWNPSLYASALALVRAYMGNNSSPTVQNTSTVNSSNNNSAGDSDHPEISGGGGKHPKDTVEQSGSGVASPPNLKCPEGYSLELTSFGTYICRPNFGGVIVEPIISQPDSDASLEQKQIIYIYFGGSGYNNLSINTGDLTFSKNEIASPENEEVILWVNGEPITVDRAFDGTPLINAANVNLALGERPFVIGQAPVWTNESLIQQRLGQNTVTLFVPYPGTEAPLLGTTVGKTQQAQYALEYLIANDLLNADIKVVGYSAGGDAALIFGSQFNEYITESDADTRISEMVLLGPTGSGGVMQGLSQKTTVWQTLMTNILDSGTNILYIDDKTGGGDFGSADDPLDLVSYMYDGNGGQYTYTPVNLLHFHPTNNDAVNRNINLQYEVFSFLIGNGDETDFEQFK